MFEGSFGPPLFITKIFNASGEDAYDLAWVEMFLIVFLILLLIFFSVNAAYKALKKRAANKQISR